jgi:hypothetical protein
MAGPMKRCGNCAHYSGGLEGGFCNHSTRTGEPLSSRKMRPSGLCNLHTFRHALSQKESDKLRLAVVGSQKNLETSDLMLAMFDSLVAGQCNGLFDAFMFGTNPGDPGLRSPRSRKPFFVKLLFGPEIVVVETDEADELPKKLSDTLIERGTRGAPSA